MVPGSVLNYIGASIKGASSRRSEGFVGHRNNSFSIRIDPLDTALCLGAANVDVNWRVRYNWFGPFWQEEPRTIVVDVWWSPLMVAAAKETVGTDK